MDRDLLRELHHLGLTARIKRLSDSLSASIRQLYQAQGVDLEPSWHLVFVLLKERETATMTEIAAALHLSQPAVTKMIKRMASRGYIDVVDDERDGRKKRLQLSHKARRELPRFEQIWDAGRRAIEEMLETNQGFLEALERFEEEVRSKSFRDRALERLSDRELGGPCRGHEEGEELTDERSR